MSESNIEAIQYMDVAQKASVICNIFRPQVYHPRLKKGLEVSWILSQFQPS